MLPVGELFLLIRQSPARMAALRGLDLPRRRFLVPRPSLFRFGLGHFEESARRGSMNLAVESLLARATAMQHALYVQHLRGDGPKPFHQPGTGLMQKILAASGHFGMESGQMLDVFAQIGRYGKSLLPTAELLGHANFPRYLLPETFQFDQLVLEVAGIGHGFYAVWCGNGEKILETPIERAHPHSTLTLYGLHFQRDGCVPLARFVQDLAGYGNTYRSSLAANGHLADTLQIQLAVFPILAWMQPPAVTVGLVSPARIAPKALESGEAGRFPILYAPEEMLKSQVHSLERDLFGLGIQPRQCGHRFTPLGEHLALV